jgi:hypothetical protein
MTTTVVDLAHVLGDDIDRSHYLLRNGERLTKLPGAQMWCDGTSRERTTA